MHLSPSYYTHHTHQSFFIALLDAIAAFYPVAKIEAQSAYALIEPEIPKPAHQYLVFDKTEYSYFGIGQLLMSEDVHNDCDTRSVQMPHRD